MRSVRRFALACLAALLVIGGPLALRPAAAVAGLNTLSISDVSGFEGDDGTSTFVFTVSMSAPTPETVEVDFSTQDGTATSQAGQFQDYVPQVNGHLTFDPLQTSKTIAITVNGDRFPEPDETFFVNLTNPQQASITDGQGLGTIRNDTTEGTPPVLTINDPSVVEGNSGTSSLVFRVTESPAQAQPTYVHYSTANGSATAGSDYTAIADQVATVPQNTDHVDITILVTGDTTDEPNETALLNLASSSNATIGDSQGVGTILDDDATPVVTLVDPTPASEGNSGTTNATFTVNLDRASSQAVAVTYATTDGTATASSDYADTHGTLTIPALSTQGTVDVPIAGDALNEPNETFSFDITNVTNATCTGGDCSGGYTIIDDDGTPTLTVTDVSMNEGNSGDANLDFTVTLSPVSGQAASFTYQTADGTATAPSDYQAVGPTSRTIPAGQTTTHILVPIHGDTISELSEQLTLSLTGPQNATCTGGDCSATGTITNDDGVPIISVADATGQEPGTDAVFHVSIDRVSDRDVLIPYATSNGTAVSGTGGSGDYTATTGALPIPAGTTTGTITVPVHDDNATEGTENFTLTLSNPTDTTTGTCSGGDCTATGTILDDESPLLYVDDTTVTEGDPSGAAVNAVFNIHLSTASANPVSFTYATHDGSARASEDYTATTGGGQIPANTTAVTINVPITGDLTPESSENFTFELSGVSGATVADGSAKGTINDNDPGTPPGLSIADVQRVEGSSGAPTNMTFTVTLSSQSANTVTVNFATADGTAKTADGDYTAVSGTLTFSPTQTTKTIDVPVDGDTIDEVDENFTVVLSDAGNAAITDGSATGTITDDDGPSIAITDVSVIEGDAGTVNATFNVSLSGPSVQPISVDWATADDTASEPADYTQGSGNLSWAAGNTAVKQVTVVVKGDTLDEPDQQFFVNLSNPIHASLTAKTAGVGTIIDDDGPTISIGDVTITEGNSGATNANFSVSLSAASPQTITVHWSTADGTAAAPADYTAASGTVTFPPSTPAAQTVTVQVKGDTLSEADEHFSVVLTNPTNATIADGTGDGTITDDDPVPSASIADASLAEGNGGGTTLMNFTVSLSAPSGQAVSVNYATADGTAKAPGDYQTRAGVLPIPAGATGGTISVPIVGDGQAEGNESFTVTLSSPTGVTINDGSATGTIIDDDGTPVLTVGDVAVAEGNSGSTSAVFTVSMVPASGSAVTVNYATGDQSATAPSDYTATSGVLIIPAGATSGTISVPVKGDTLSENDETFALTLSNPSGATCNGGDCQATGTITNDDSGPAASVADASVKEGDTGTSALTFDVSLSTVSGRTVTVHYATSDGTATASADYQATAGTLDIPAGQTTGSVVVPVVGDTQLEGDETILLTLTSVDAGSVADGQGIGTIVDDDGATAQGYTLVGEDGSLYAFGSAQNLGDMKGKALNGKIIGVAYTPGGKGYWLVGSDGGIFTFGDAKFYGSMGGTHLNSPVIGMAATPTGKGYWLFSADGGIFSFGDAKFFGSMGGTHLNAPVVNMEPTASGAGYWLVGADGGIFSFGNAKFFGSMGGSHVNQPVFDMTSTDTDQGYWLVARDGGIFSFGDAAPKFYGSAVNAVPVPTKIIGMDSTPDSLGYWIADADGKVYHFGDATDLGDRYFNSNPAPMVAFAAVPA